MAEIVDTGDCDGITSDARPDARSTISQLFAHRRRNACQDLLKFFLVSRAKLIRTSSGTFQTFKPFTRAYVRVMFGKRSSKKLSMWNDAGMRRRGKNRDATGGTHDASAA
ncbi:hypothetical protein [Paraburkholderia sp. BR10882]|uniref:hypothetical protein n=1 Tax=unclassified Paraburkholderia TaxID=2615204 RepID=UPI0034CD0E2B